MPDETAGPVGEETDSEDYEWARAESAPAEDVEILTPAPVEEVEEEPSVLLDTGVFTTPRENQGEEPS